MKSHLRIEILGNRTGSIEKRESYFTTSGAGEALNTLHDAIKEFSTNRGKKKITVSLTIEKGKRS